MARVFTPSTNFTTGEITPKALGRIDIAAYNNGCAAMINAIPQIYGGFTRRPGSRFVAAAKGTTSTILLPYVFNKSQAYVLELGDQYMRVFKNSAQVLSGGSPYEIATPYNTARLSGIDYAQRADTMILTHGDFKPRKLQRFEDNRWVMENVTFSQVPFGEIGERPAATLTLSARTVGSGRTFTASAASFRPADVGREVTAEGGVAVITAYTSTTEVTCRIDEEFSSTSVASGTWVIQGSPQTTCTPSAAGPVGKVITLTLGTSGWNSTDTGRHVEINGGLVKIVGYTSGTVVDAKIKRKLDSTVAAEADAWILSSDLWSNDRGWPRTVTFHQQRLILAGTADQPQTVWGSNTGDYFRFDIGTGDSDGFAFDLSADEVNEIMYATSMRDLVVLSAGNEFTMAGGVEKPIAPTNVQVQDRSNNGTAEIRPVRVGNEELFVERTGRRILGFRYDYGRDDYVQPDLTLLAEHLLDGRSVVSMAYQPGTTPRLWVVRSDGVMLICILDRDQNIVGWCRATTAGNYKFVTVIPVEGGYQVWALVRRTVDGSAVQYVEVFDDELQSDCAITGTNGSPTAVWSGLDHLEGLTVWVKGDGCYLGEFVVDGGEVTLDAEVSSVEIGLAYETTVELLPPEIQLQQGSSLGGSKRIGEVILRVHKTAAATINGQAIDFRRFGDGLLDGEPPEFTGIVRLNQLGWFKGDAPLVISQNVPMPLHVLSVVRRVTVNDG